MLKYILPIILIGGAVAVLVLFVFPGYDKVKNLSAEVSAKQQALKESAQLEREREDLTRKFNNISIDNRNKLEKFLPDNVDNIRLILELNDVVAVSNGMTIKEIRYDSSQKGKSGAPAQQEIDNGLSTDLNQYGTWNLEFTTEGSYKNFLSFLRSLESNLRLLDIESITFDSQVENSIVKNNPVDFYKYSFKVKTYWLKN